VFEATKEALTQQDKQKGALETKANILTAFAGGMFGLLMSSFDTIQLFEILSQIMIVISVILFVFSVFLATLVLWVRRYRTDPNPEMLGQTYISKPALETRLQVTSNMIAAWKANHTILERNSQYLRAGFVIQAAAFILLGVSFLITLFQ
jgi:hypothetical protein